MEEREFLTQADAEIARIEAALERLQDESAADIDFEQKPGGIIEITCGDDSKIIVNRHAAAREIWVAARAGGFHFAPPTGGIGPWVAGRTGEALVDVLSRCLSAQLGEPIQLTW